MRGWMIGLLGLLAAARAGAQEVRGVVVEDETGAPIAGVSVQLLSPDSMLRGTAVTDTAGAFHLAYRQGGRHLLRVAHSLYVAGGDLPIELKERAVLNVLVRMGHATIPLEPLVVTATSHDRMRGFRARAAGRGQGRYILRGELDRLDPLTATELMNQQPNLRVESFNVGGGVAHQLMMRTASERCPPTILVDGLVFARDMELDHIAVENLEGVEIYQNPGTVPAELHVVRDGCGLIAFWTRAPRGGALTWRRVGLAALIVGLIVNTHR